MGNFILSSRFPQWMAHIIFNGLRNGKIFIEWKELKNLWKQTDNLFDMSLIGLYTILPPRRVKDANLITITHSTANLNPELNYILLDGDNKPIKLIYQNYKTASVYGKQTIDIPAKLSKIIEKYIAEYGLLDNNPLFGNNQQKYYRNFGELITKTFKKYIETPISANTLRHSYIIAFLKKKKRTPNEKKLIADMMAHSVEMQSMYDRV